MAERAAWDFIRNEGGDMELSVINPVAIFGPSLGPDLSSGFGLVKTVIDGNMKYVPNMTFNIVDVRDVADLHIRAMTNPAAKGQRFLALAGGIMSLPEIARLIKQKMPEVSAKISTKTMPDWAVRIAALFNPKAKAIASMLGVNRNTSNAKARTVLQWQPVANNEEAVLASVKSMVKFGNIK
jgi:nucleoside-diphosphate-sugar epimerase